MTKIYVLGVGEDGPAGMPAKALDLVRSARLLAGGTRHLGFFPDHPGPKVVIKGTLEPLFAALEHTEGHAVVLASGDPLFYGIGSRLVERFGVQHVEVWPSVSSMQLAFARLGLGWDDATLYSVHARGMKGLARLVASHPKVGLFTDDVSSPSAIGRYLAQWGLGDVSMFVGERLGGSKERCWMGTALQAADLVFDPLNVVVLINRHVRIWATPGIHEDEFQQRKPLKGLITKWEVRVLALSRMSVAPAKVVWDIGTGSGSVAVEAALVDPSVTVFAIEKNAEDCDIARQNFAKFITDNVELIHAVAPEACEALPDPDAVFVGGSGGRLAEILRVACIRLRKGGCLVADVATIENLREALEGMASCGLAPEVCMVNVARSKEIIGLTRFEALNPVFIVWARKKAVDA
jgi:precorrin-6Y C5,15-methyltransferase (decarboxylating)